MQPWLGAQGGPHHTKRLSADKSSLGTLGGGPVGGRGNRAPCTPPRLPPAAVACSGAVSLSVLPSASLPSLRLRAGSGNRASLPFTSPPDCRGVANCAARFPPTRRAAHRHRRTCMERTATSLCKGRHNTPVSSWRAVRISLACACSALTSDSGMENTSERLMPPGSVALSQASP